MFFHGVAEADSPIGMRQEDVGVGRLYFGLDFLHDLHAAIQICCGTLLEQQCITILVAQTDQLSAIPSVAVAHSSQITSLSGSTAPN